MRLRIECIPFSPLERGRPRTDIRQGSSHPTVIRVRNRRVLQAPPGPLDSIANRGTGHDIIKRGAPSLTSEDISTDQAERRGGCKPLLAAIASRLCTCRLQVFEGVDDLHCILYH
jgi:hypothetical protein